MHSKDLSDVIFFLFLWGWSEEKQGVHERQRDGLVGKKRLSVGWEGGEKMHKRQTVHVRIAHKRTVFSNVRVAPYKN